MSDTVKAIFGVAILILGVVSYALVAETFLGVALLIIGGYILFEAVDN